MMNMVKFCDEAFDAKMRFYSELINIARRNEIPYENLVCYLESNCGDPANIQDNMDLAKHTFVIDFPNSVAGCSEDK